MHFPMVAVSPSSMQMMGALNMNPSQFTLLAATPQGALVPLQAQAMAMAMPPQMFMQMMGGGGMPPNGMMMPPMMMMPVMGPICGGGYGMPGQGLGAPQRMNLEHNSFNQRGNTGEKTGSGKGARQLERRLTNDPSFRASFEQQMGGRVINDGNMDGKIQIMPFQPGFAPIPGMAANPMVNNTMSMFGGMEMSLGKMMALGAGKGALGGAGKGLMAGLMTGSPFMGLAAGGLLGALGGAGTGMGMGMMGKGMGSPMGMMGAGMLPGGMKGGPLAQPGLFGPMTPMGMLAGAGMGMWNPMTMPGNMQNSNPMYEVAHQMQCNGILADPSLTVEDKVTLLLMQIMKKMDQDILRQANYINSLQQQQNKSGKMGPAKAGLGKLAGGALGSMVAPGAGTKIGSKIGGGIGGKAGGKGGEKSIDVESMKLKRMIDKRGQMFDILKSIIDKYNETAKGIIQSIGR